MPAPDLPTEAPLSSLEAVAAIDRATAFAEPLRRRSEGVTIAIWGFVTACVFLTAGVADDVYGMWDAGGWRRLVSAFLWLPWASLGVLATIAVWRIAELSARRAVPGRRQSVVALLGWLAMLAGLAIAIAVFVPLASAGYGIVLVGLLWLAIGTLDLYRATPAGRRTILAVGGAIVAAGAVFGWVARGWPDDGWSALEPVGVAAAGLIPILGGLWQALRG